MLIEEYRKANGKQIVSRSARFRDGYIDSLAGTL